MYGLIVFFLTVALTGCAAKPSDPCMAEYRECVKGFVVEKLYCRSGGDTEDVCQKSYEIGRKECGRTYAKCAERTTPPDEGAQGGAG